MAARAFGDGTVYLERYVPKARHIEVQVFGFGDGRAVHLYERECSVQRRFQKVIEEAPSPAVDDGTRAAMTEAAVALAESQNYAGAGTVEFIFDDETGGFYFLEMNTRIQVEHAVTEMITGLDLVQMQLRLARGDDFSAFSQDEVKATGHAIEVRVYAENPAKNFMPSPGRLDRAAFPVPGRDVRIDTGFEEGDEITPHYDPLIAKLIVRGEDRAGGDRALRRCASPDADRRARHQPRAASRRPRSSGLRRGPHLHRFPRHSPTRAPGAGLSRAVCFPEVEDGRTGSDPVARQHLEGAGQTRRCRQGGRRPLHHGGDEDGVPRTRRRAPAG